MRAARNTHTRTTSVVLAATWPVPDSRRVQVNLGDEIGIAAPPSYANDTAFEEYCKQHAISLDMLGCDDTNCELLACQGVLCHVCCIV